MSRYPSRHFNTILELLIKLQIKLQIGEFCLDANVNVDVMLVLHQQLVVVPNKLFSLVPAARDSSCDGSRGPRLASAVLPTVLPALPPAVLVELGHAERHPSANRDAHHRAPLPTCGERPKSATYDDHDEDCVSLGLRGAVTTRQDKSGSVDVQRCTVEHLCRVPTVHQKYTHADVEQDTQTRQDDALEARCPQCKASNNYKKSGGFCGPSVAGEPRWLSHPSAEAKNNRAYARREQNSHGTVHVHIKLKQSGTKGVMSASSMQTTTSRELQTDCSSPLPSAEVLARRAP